MKGLAAYPLSMLLDARVLVTNKSDDPPYFGGYLNANYAAVSKSLLLSHEMIAQLTRIDSRDHSPRSTRSPPA